MKWRKLNRILHRDLGYFFFGMTVIYALSGIALNHIDDWNPSYSIETQKVQLHNIPDNKSQVNRDYAREVAAEFGEADHFKNYYFPEANTMKVFLDDGSITLNLKDGSGKLEKSSRRPVFYEVNWLHYNPNNWWTWFSDIYAGGLIIIAVTGLFILRGKQGIKGRGAWLTAAGVLLPILFLLIFQ